MNSHLTVVAALFALSSAMWPAASAADPPPESVQAWMELEETMAWMRQVITDEAASPLETTDGIEYMLANLFVALDNSLSAMNSGVTFHHFRPPAPLVGCPNPDQDYRVAPLDADGLYRIHGNLHDTAYLSMVIYGYVPKEQQKIKGWGSTLEGMLDSRDIAFEADGSFELFVGAKRPKGVRNWLELKPNAREIMIRTMHHDRTKERPAVIDIERLDAATERSTTSAENLAAGQQMLRQGELAHHRLSDAQVATWVRRITANTRSVLQFRKAMQVVDAESGVRAANQAVVITMANAAARQAQPNPLVNYMNIRMEIGEGESLLIEGRPPDAPYWSVAFCDYWMSNPGGRTRGWLNDGTVELEPDGSYRIVVGPEDPGVTNWIDTTGHTRGGLLWRFVSGDAVPDAAKVTVVKTSELR